MPEDSQEIFIAIAATMVTFLTIAGVLVYFILHFQRKKFEHQQQLIRSVEESRRQLVQAKLEVEEQTRNYIARELHDNIGTLASLIKINLNLSSQAGPEYYNEEFLRESKELIRVLITEVKQLSVSLNTDRIAEMRFSQTMQMQIDRIQKLKLFVIDYSVTGDEWAIPPDKQIILFRICQELLHNTIKHAKASRLELHLVYDRDTLSVSIADNGIGFVPNHRESSQTMNGSGLLNCRNRINLIGGELIAESHIGEGSRFMIRIPRSLATNDDQ